MQRGILSTLSGKYFGLTLCLIPTSFMGNGRPGFTVYSLAEDLCRGRCLSCIVQATLPKGPLIKAVTVGWGSGRVQTVIQVSDHYLKCLLNIYLAIDVKVSMKICPTFMSKRNDILLIKLETGSSQLHYILILHFARINMQSKYMCTWAIIHKVNTKLFYQSVKFFAAATLKSTWQDIMCTNKN